MTTEIKPYEIAIPDSELDALHQKLQLTRWPEAETCEGWDQGKLAEMRNLRSADLDPVSRANPVWLGHTSGHFGVANSLALELAGILDPGEDQVDP